jgi:GDP-L-fucose synthase
MEESRKAGVEKFVGLGTVWCYPEFTKVPFKEENLWNGYPEENGAPYGLAKKMLLVQGQAYRKQYGFNSVFLMPINLYGPGDNSSHIVPTLVKKFLDAKKNNIKSVVVFGTGNPIREFLFVKDCAEAILLATEKYDKPDPINIGSGQDILMKDLASLIADLTSFGGEIVWDKSMPDGQLERKLDISKAKKEFGFSAKTDFKEGLVETIEWHKGKQNKNL